MEKNIMFVGIVGIAVIVGIVLFVNSTISGLYFAADDYYVRPSGLQFRVESGVAVLQHDMPVISSCRNSAVCSGEAAYSCCNHDGSECILPAEAEESRGACPATHRARCQCREDYIAGLMER